jgi:hypothetical protein
MKDEGTPTEADPPFLLLEVDGPLNPCAAKPSRRPVGYETHRARPSGWRLHEARRPLRVWKDFEALKAWAKMVGP